MFRKIFIVQPDTKQFSAHKWFAFFEKFFIMSKVEIVDVSTRSDCLTYLDFLFLCRIHFCFEAL